MKYINRDEEIHPGFFWIPNGFPEEKKREEKRIEEKRIEEKKIKEVSVEEKKAFFGTCSCMKFVVY